MNSYICKIKDLQGILCSHLWKYSERKTGSNAKFGRKMCYLPNYHTRINGRKIQDVNPLKIQKA